MSLFQSPQNVSVAGAVHDAAPCVMAALQRGLFLLGFLCLLDFNTAGAPGEGSTVYQSSDVSALSASTAPRSSTKELYRLTVR